jgi:hypothetical protein
VALVVSLAVGLLPACGIYLVQAVRLTFFRIYFEAALYK